MEEKNYTGTIPENREGDTINAGSVAELPDTESATALFNTAKARLLDVNNWHKIAGEEMAKFQLADENGKEVYDVVKEGFFFKIDIPGPGTKSGDGYDWVKVEEVKEYSSLDVDSIGIRVRPASNPTTNDAETAHFYSHDSTSTFTVTREKTKVTAAVYDRNTKPNPDSENLIDKIRNIFVGVVGKTTFSKIQWKSLTDGLINMENE